MKTFTLKSFNWLFLFFMCIFSISMGIYAARPWGDNYAYQNVSDYVSLSGYLLWTISPYGALSLMLYIISRKKILLKTFTAGMFSISLFAVIILIDTNFIHIDAQGGLVLLFLPVWQWIAVTLFILIFLVVQARTVRSV